jgi:hypothetical protein
MYFMLRIYKKRCLPCFFQKSSISIADISITTITTGTTTATAKTALCFFFDDLGLHGSPFAVSYLNVSARFLHNASGNVPFSWFPDRSLHKKKLSKELSY